ncbi:DNA mismatch repair protein, putative [Plasmodium gallinaceum]|uniref:DNA mismatch repair protein, putative n=1 Tax=Plasmodium gallinaceum TaxID=5849 RepID=A0A1J1GT03_PLAGA|nr:DNA mismatch repair protein, putative [Plasmodium gallinaceum]CRG95575.1 DNA mismatch repair protein, putative [Plasmodium gallinaceum]
MNGILPKYILIFSIFLISLKNIMSLKKKLMFNYFNRKRIVNVKNIVYLNRNYINNLIYTKEDDIYKITKLEDYNIINNKKINSSFEDKNNIISNSNFENISDNNEKTENKIFHSYNENDEKLKNFANINEKFLPSDNELKLYKNKWKIPLYWIKKLENLKNINAINCIDYLKDDNLLYFDNYKNKGLLKFLNDEKKKFSNCIILSRVGDFYETYGLDSIFLIEFLNIKKMNNKLSCGFIKSSINKALNILTNNNLNICIYEEINEKSLKMKKRYLSQIVTPEFPLYLNNIQYCNSLDETNISDDSENKPSNYFYNLYDLDDYFVIKEIVCIYIESRNIFSLSKINLSLKTIAIYDHITFDVLNIYLKNTNFLKVYIHQHNNTSFTKKITQLFKIENYYLFNNFNNSFHFHMFILDKLKKQINIKGLFRLIKNKNVFKIKSMSNKKNENNKNDKISDINDSNYVNNENVCFNDINCDNSNERIPSQENVNYKNNTERNINSESSSNNELSTNNYRLENNFDYSYYSYCTPLNIFTSYNMGIYKQNNCYENRDSYLFFNIIDVNNNDSKSINIIESLEFFKNLFLFYPPFEVTKHIRFINDYIQKNLKNLIIPNVKPFRNNIVITLLSNLKADYNILKKIFINIQSVINCMHNFEFSLLISIFHVLNHQNSFKLNIIKFYELLISIEKILKYNLEFSSIKFSVESDIILFNDFVYYHENHVHNIINEKLLIEENKEIEKNRKELLETIISNYAEYNELEKKYDLDLLNKIIKIDNVNDIIGVKKKKKNEKTLNFFHPLNKKSDLMKNIFVTENVQKKIKSYLCSIDRKKQKINETIKRINIQLSSSVHILSFVSNFLQIIQALYNHTINSIKRKWNLPICKHLFLTYEYKDFNNINDKLLYIQKLLYNETNDESCNKNSYSKNKFLSEKKNDNKNNYNYTCDEEFLKLTEEDKKKLKENVDEDSIEEIKKVYEKKNYVNDSLTYILGAKPYNINKENLVKYDVFFKKKNFILLTGKNMSGKTTLSFTILCILFLANLGLYAPCDKKSIISKFREFYSLKNVNYHEQIENMSLFREQAFYINSIIEEIKENYSFDKKESRENEIFILFDEPCIATTPIDNAIIISAISDYLKNYCGIIITHNYDLLKKICQSENIIFKRINENINYLKRQESEQVTKLENGICKDSEALETCRYTNTDSKVLHLLNIYEKKYKLIHNLNNILYYKFLDYLKYKKEKRSLNDFFDSVFIDINDKNLEKYKYNDIKNDSDLMQDKELQNLINYDIIKKELFINDNKENINDSQIDKNGDENNNKSFNDISNEILDEKNNYEIYESELNIAIKKIEQISKKKILKIGMNEEIPIYFKNKSIVYILCIFAKNEKRPYFYIGISDNISERIKCHSRNLLNNKNLLKNAKKNNILNYKFDLNIFYTLLFHVENKKIASKYEKELTILLKKDYDLISN